MMRRLLMPVIVLFMAVPCWGAQWFVDATDGDDAKDGKQTWVLASAKTGIVVTQAGTAVGSTISLYSSTGAFGSSTTANKVGNVFYLEDEGDAADFAWVRITSHTAYQNVAGVVFGQASTLENGDTVKTGTGQMKTLPAVVTAAQSAGDHSIWLGNDTYTLLDQLVIGSDNVAADRNLTITSLNQDATLVTVTYNDPGVVDAEAFYLDIDAGDFTASYFTANGGNATTQTFVLIPDVAASSGGHFTFDHMVLASPTSAGWAIDSGDGIYPSSRTLTVTNCEFDNFIAAAMYIQYFEAVDISDCTFAESGATPTAGHLNIHSEVRDGLIENCTFTSAATGDAVVLIDNLNNSHGGRIEVRDCTITAPMILLCVDGVDHATDYFPWNLSMVGNTITQSAGASLPGIKFGQTDPLDADDWHGSAYIMGNTITQATGVTQEAVYVGGKVKLGLLSNNKIITASAGKGVEMRCDRGVITNNAIAGTNLISLSGAENVLVSNNSLYIGSAGYGLRVSDDSENTTLGVRVPTGHSFTRNILHVNNASAYGFQFEHGARPDRFLCDDNLYYFQAGNAGKFARFETTDAAYDDAPIPTLTKVANYAAYTAAGETWVMVRPSAASKTVASNTDDTVVLSEAIGGGDLANVYSYIVFEVDTFAALAAYWATIGDTGVARANDRNSTSANPRFISPSSGDLRIGGSSPAKGTQTGTPNLATWNGLGAWQQRASGTKQIEW